MGRPIGISLEHGSAVESSDDSSDGLSRGRRSLPASAGPPFFGIRSDWLRDLLFMFPFYSSLSLPVSQQILTDRPRSAPFARLWKSRTPRRKHCYKWGDPG